MSAANRGWTCRIQHPASAKSGSSGRRGRSHKYSHLYISRPRFVYDIKLEFKANSQNFPAEEMFDSGSRYNAPIHMRNHDLNALALTFALQLSSHLAPCHSSNTLLSDKSNRLGPRLTL